MVNYGVGPAGGPQVPSTERVGTAQRTAVLDLLSRALEQGYIELGEYEVRMAAIQSARTVGDLTGQTADLPHQFRWQPQHQPAPVPPPASQLVTGKRNPMSQVALTLSAVSIALSICLGAGVLFGLGGIALSLPGLKAKDTMSRIALVLGCIGTLLSVAIIVFMIATGSYQGSAT
ncbi:hypothetical protein GCM10027290_32070 [Micromonospora sonneratiae]|uniref:DUF1707 domain-containing protein n=1 Tax=Micromonospora sonneratiae TaxID=1184706 RepID=A0ABW3Y9Z0_9ACTN